MKSWVALVRKLTRGGVLAGMLLASHAGAQASPEAAANAPPPAQSPPAQSPPAQSPPAQSPPAQSPPAQSPPAEAEPAEETEVSAARGAVPTAQRAGVGLLAAAGLHSGFGLGARLGLGDVGLEVAGGYQVLVAVWDGNGGVRDRHLDLGSSAQVGSELFVTPWHPGKTSAVGLKAGYRYNSVLKHGLAAAITFLVTLSPHVALEGLAGTQAFPGSEGRLRRKLALANDADIVYGSQLQWFEYGFELIWYP